MTVFVAESSSAVKKTLAKAHKRTVTRNKEPAANTDSDATERTQCTAASEEQNRRKQHLDNAIQRTSTCKLFSVPQTALYEHLLAKLKRPAYLVRMKKRLVKYEGKMQHGKDVVCISQKNLAKLLRLLDSVTNTDGVKCKTRKNVRKISKLLQNAVHA